jgi:purine-nucleoside phosphorylase
VKQELLNQGLEVVRGRWPDATPLAGMILGSGWSPVVEAFEIMDEMAYEELPGLGQTRVKGHAGRLARVQAHGREALIFQGRRHWYEGEGWTPIALPVFILKSLGARLLFLTNSAGGIREDLKPGALMVIDDHINHMSNSPLIGAHDPFWGARFPDQTAVYDEPLRAMMHQAAAQAGVTVTSGTYLAASGPAYETPAEIRAFKTLGADAVGMSTVPEAMLAHAAGLRVVGLSCITNMASGISPEKLTHDEVTATAREAMQHMRAVMKACWEAAAHDAS